MARYPSFEWLNNILMCVCVSVCVCVCVCVCVKINNLILYRKAKKQDMGLTKGYTNESSKQNPENDLYVVNRF